MTLTAKVNKSGCIGAGKCVATAPQAFGFDEDETSRPLDTLPSVPEKQVLRAAGLCPVLAISVFDAQGEKIFPRESDL